MESRGGIQGSGDEGKRPVGRPRHRRDNIIHMDHRVSVWESMKGLIYSGWGQNVGCCKDGEEYWGVA